ncbi:hypothetical protein IL306_003463 [Fusarium sp. DS 682]|nr:hypothetical protein IL306_003463 [Fusarium sp. DS 682]
MAASPREETVPQLEKDIRIMEIKKIAREIQHLEHFLGSIPPIPNIALTDEDIRIAREINPIKNITTHRSLADCVFPREWVEEVKPLAVALRDWREQVEKMYQKDEPAEDNQAQTTDIMTNVDIKGNASKVSPLSFPLQREEQWANKAKELEKKLKQSEAERKCTMQHNRDLRQHNEVLEGRVRSLLQAVFDSNGDIHEKNVKAKVDLNAKIRQLEYVVETKTRNNQVLATQIKESEAHNDILVAENKDLASRNEGLISKNNELEKSVATFQNMNEVLIAKNKAIESSNAVLVAENKKLKTVNKDLSEANKDLKESLDKTLQSSKTIDQVLSAKITELESKNEAMVAENKDLKTKNKAQTEIIKDLEERLTLVFDVETSEKGSKRASRIKVILKTTDLRPKFEETFRFDYEPRHERIIFRMPSRIHDIFAQFIQDAIFDAVSDLGRNNEQVRPFTAKVVKAATSDIFTFDRDDDPVAKQRSPDAQLIHVDAQQPSVVIEVAASQDAKELSKLAKGYIHDTWGDIKAVLCFALNKTNGSTISVWKPKYETEQGSDESVLTYEQVVQSQPFRTYDKKPIN